MIFSLILLAVMAAIATFALVFVLNIVGLPGALIARNEPRASSLKWWIGFLIATIGQYYLAASYVAFVVNWTKLGIEHQDLNAWLFWPLAFLASVLPLTATYKAALREAREHNSSNVSLDALGWATLLAIPSFFVFLFFPQFLSAAFSWVPYID
ncbi:hypothetical protein ACXYN8_02515 [Altererythrobacter sp. CAU 1778]